MESLAQRFRRLSQLPRRPDRAKIHFLPRGAVPSLSEEDWEDVAEGNEELLAYLQQRDLRRGDIIVVEEHLEDDERRDRGKLAFDGEEIVSWNFDEDRARFLPRQFQVVKEFPLQYWSEVFDNPDEALVPFDFSRRLEGLSDLRIHTIRAPRGIMKTIPFQDQQGQVYYILGDENNFMGDFERVLPHLDYFGVLNPRSGSYDYFSAERLPGGVDADRVLFIPSVGTPAR